MIVKCVLLTVVVLNKQSLYLTGNNKFGTKIKRGNMLEEEVANFREVCIGM